MKFIGLFLFLFFTTACGAQNAVNQPQSTNPKSEIPIPKSNPVLVELFTSEGCSSCPAADRALAFLEKEQPYPQAEIITLALHVDYFNEQGWVDEFSAPLFTQRQEFYTKKFKLGSSYTPQMIVDGQTEFTGSNSGKAAKAIAEAAKLQKGKIEIVRLEDKIKIKLADFPEHTDANVFLAIAEDNLSTKIGGGENSGKTLEHQSVVRQLKSIRSLKAPENGAEIETSLTLAGNWKKENLRIIVFVQENESRKILGVGRIAFEQK